MGRLGTMQTATNAVTEHRPPNALDWSQTDLQAECRRPNSSARRGRPLLTAGEKTSNNVPKRRDHGNKSCMMQGDSEDPPSGLTATQGDASSAPTEA